MSEKENIKSFFLRYRYELLALMVLLIYLSPNIFFPHKARYLVHDNLNSNVVWYKNLAESGKMFAANEEIIPNSLGGVPRGCYPSELNVMHLLYLVFSALTAYNINSIVMHVVAFFGMLLLLKRYLNNTRYPELNVIIALLFSLLPFWPSGGLAIAGQPILLYAFLNIYNSKDRLMDWFIVCFIPFYSLFALSGLFLFIILGITLIADTLIKRRINFKSILALSIFLIATIISEHRLFYMQFIEHFESHREHVRVLGTLNIKGLIGVSLLHFFKSQYHFHSLHTPLILILILIGLYFGTRKQKLLIVLFLIISYLFSLLLVLPSLSHAENYFKGADLLKKITLRFYSLFPLIWFFLLGFCVKIISETRYKFIIKTAYIFLFFQCLLQLFSINSKDYQECDFSENTFYRTYFDNNNNKFLTFDEYYKPDIFKKIKSSIDNTGYSACIGFASEIAQYNKINTIDGYFYYFSNAKYNVMKKINKDIDSANGVNESGNYCILNIPNYRIKDNCIHEPKWNFQMLDSLNVKNFISKYCIMSNELTLLEKFASKEGEYYVYTNKIGG